MGPLPGPPEPNPVPTDPPPAVFIIGGIKLPELPVPDDDADVGNLKRRWPGP